MPLECDPGDPPPCATAPGAALRSRTRRTGLDTFAVRPIPATLDIADPGLPAGGIPIPRPGEVSSVPVGRWAAFIDAPAAGRPDEAPGGPTGAVRGPEARRAAGTVRS